MNKIGLVAGNGQIPLILSRILYSKKIYIYTIAYINEADSKIKKISTKIKWIYPGQINSLIKFFKKNNINKIIIIGSLNKSKIIRNLKPDIRAISIIIKAKKTSDDFIIRSFSNSLKTLGINIEPYISFIPKLNTAKGIWTKSTPSKREYKDIEFGLYIAKEIGKLDIGQSIIIEKGSIIAIETIEGTDSIIKRSKIYCNKKAVLVKLSKPNQDKRFDLPTVGVQTIKHMYKNNIRVLAIESENTIVINVKETINKANKYKIAIVCF